MIIKPELVSPAALDRTEPMLRAPPPPAPDPYPQTLAPTPDPRLLASNSWLLTPDS